jgi:hypothetical protein
LADSLKLKDSPPSPRGEGQSRFNFPSDEMKTVIKEITLNFIPIKKKQGL